MSNSAPTWTTADQALAETMTSYWVNFAKTATRSNAGLPAWPAFRTARSRVDDLWADGRSGTRLDPARIALFNACNALK